MLPDHHDDGKRTLRAWRLHAYAELRRERPELFENPPGAGYEIILDPDLQAEVMGQCTAWQRSAGLPEQYGDLGIVYEDPFITLIKDAVRFRSGQLGAYIRSIPTMSTVTAGAVVLVAHDGKVILVRHFRHASRRWHWEAVRGFGSAGEAREDTARREVAEELGAQVTKIVPLGFLRMDGGLPRDLPQVFWAETTKPSALERDEGIDEMIAVGPRQLDSMISDGELNDAFTLSAIAYARARGLLR